MGVFIANNKIFIKLPEQETIFRGSILAARRILLRHIVTYESEKNAEQLDNISVSNWVETTK